MVRRAAAAWVVSERDRDSPRGRPRAPRRGAAAGAAAGGRRARAPAAPAGGADDRPLLAVTGNLGYFATAEGLRWWLDEVWPLARAQHPGLRLLLAGARPPGWLRRAPAIPRRAVARDPEDLRALLAAATIALAPARAGAGRAGEDPRGLGRRRAGDRPSRGRRRARAAQPGRAPVDRRNARRVAGGDRPPARLAGRARAARGRRPRAPARRLRAGRARRPPARHGARRGLPPAPRRRSR